MNARLWLISILLFTCWIADFACGQNTKYEPSDPTWSNGGFARPLEDGTEGSIEEDGLPSDLPTWQKNAIKDSMTGYGLRNSNVAENDAAESQVSSGFEGGQDQHGIFSWVRSWQIDPYEVGWGWFLLCLFVFILVGGIVFVVTGAKPSGEVSESRIRNEPIETEEEREQKKIDPFR